MDTYPRACLLGALVRSRLMLMRFLGALGLAISSAASALTLDVLWYTYAHPSSEYVSFYSALARSGSGGNGAYPDSSMFTWNLTFFGPSDAAPSFGNYDVLVVHSGEAFRTGAPEGSLATPNYAGILDNKIAIEAARGLRTFISGSDADFHAVRGDSGNCPAVHCGDFDGARGYVINAVNWAATGVGLGILSFYHGEFAGSFWWNDPRSFLRSELEGKWSRRVDNAPVIPASAAGYSVNQGLSSEGLSDWTNSFHGIFSNIPGYVSTVDSGVAPGFSASIATIDLCRPTPASFCIAATVDEPASGFLLIGGISLLFLSVSFIRRPRRLFNNPCSAFTDCVSERQLCCFL